MAKRPKWKSESVIRASAALNELAAKHREVLEPRLAPGLIDGLDADAKELRGDTSGAMESRAARKAATATQDAAAVQGAELVSAVRSAIRGAFPGEKAMQRAFGVGTRVAPGKVASVAGALDTLLKAAATRTDKVREAGILPADLERAAGLLEALLGADRAQEAKKVTAKVATARRAKTQLRIEAAIGRIMAAAEMAFLDDPAVLAQFRAAVP